MRYWSFLGGLLLVLPIAGCNFFNNESQVYGDAPANSLRGQCERAAYDDPEVKAAVAESAIGAGYAQADTMARLAAVRRVAVQRCVTQRGGGGVGGGVDLPRS